MDAVIVRILTDVSAMLPSSGYTRQNTLKNCLSSVFAAIRKFRGGHVSRERSLTTRSEERRLYSQVIDYFMYAQIPGFDCY